MNEIIAKIMDHRSIRSFEDRLLTSEQIEVIVQSAQAASTSSFVQAYTIIGITDAVKKAALAELAGPQSYVENNGHLFMFCADLHRHEIVAEMEEMDLSEPLESTEKFMVATIDVALAAQNAALAAESMGLGICYIGGIRNHLPEVTKLLNIPSKVIPLFGMAVGYPMGQSEKKPRLPIENVYHENEYQPDKEKFIAQLEKYNDTISGYYRKRTNAVRKDTWTSQMVGMITKKSRLYMKDFVERQGLNKR
ncbi:oxygen-insensitive NADPH nitroreductase [Peribacillus loiseleuriae]|uniref:NADPH-dependent oxidoreductase n=1 Tax=Peribacillus loiseleuriae TaxID=1679170 RepID=A0A0K9GQG0_9BACI|nr:oxygen-insensitive NADPH nitroreductase [Peribacillus loiseleuriae]KMY48895.1 NADPH-dependent oxidoreductase [Peribacillus loiseleuriae]